MVGAITYLIQIMSSIGKSRVDNLDNALNLVSTRPLRITGMPIRSPHILPYFGSDRLQQEVIYWVQVVRKYEFGPC